MESPVNHLPPQNRHPAAKVLGPLFLLGLLLGGLWLADLQRLASSTSPEEQVEGNLASMEATEPPDVSALVSFSSPLIPTPALEVDEAFARIGEPSSVRPYPRGPNAERRFHSPVTVSVPATALQAAAVSMALSPMDGRVQLLPEEWDLHTKSARRMVLDVAALEKVVAGETAHLLAPRPDGSALKLVIHSVKSRAGMTHTLQGEVEGEPQSSVVQWVLHDGIVHGTVSRYSVDQHFEYRILESGYMMVRELDNASLIAQCGDPGIAGELLREGSGPETAASQEEEPVGDTAGYVTIDVVVGYDKEARAADGGYAQMEARIIASVDRMTSAFANSQVTATELMLLGTIEDPDYVFPGRSEGTMGGTDELGDLNNTAASNPQLNAVSDYATALGADLKAFIVKQADGSAGVAYRPGTSSITARDYMTASRITFGHELGHNIGARHSWGDTSGTDAVTNVHSYGWRLAPAGQTRVRTIMAYDWNWGSGTRIPYFANPNVLYQGARTGQVNGYDASGDSLSDPRYVSGGLIGGLGSGFNGSHLNLGARNAHFILAEAPGRASLQARKLFELLAPATASTWAPDDTIGVSWTGGDHTQTVAIALYKDGVLQSPIASGLSALARNHSWIIPTGIASGNNYFLRLTLTGGLTADSGLFNIFGSGLAISPFGGLTVTWEPGGPFAPESITYTLVNPGLSAFSWSASVDASWVSISQNGGTLAPDESQSLIVSLNAGASELAVGEYHATLTITDLGTGNEHERPITLQAMGRPQISIEHPTGTTLPPMAAVIDFGDVFRSAQASRRLVIRNSGVVDLLLSNPQLSGPQASAFSLSPLSATTIRPGASASFSVVFSPTAQSAHEATLSLFSNDSLASTLLVQLTGMGDQLTNKVELVANIETVLPRINPTSSLSMGSYALITVITPEHGNELWRTDGTEVGTHLLADLNPGTGSSHVAQLARVGNLAYFSATTAATGFELWVTDGTLGGTRMVRDINPGLGSSNPGSYASVGSTVYFRAATSANGSELWKTDGTAGGTVMVADIFPGTQSSVPTLLTEFNGELYFVATGPNIGSELYKSDGTAAGTVLVKDINSGGNGSEPNQFTVVGNTLFFTALTNVGRELWKTDGTEAGTVLVMDIVTGTGSSTPTDLVALNDILYFRAATSAAGSELWRSDGTAAGTMMVKDIYPGTLGGTSGSLTVFNGKLYFVGTVNQFGSELWTSDGTADGTVMLLDINPLSLSSTPSNFRVANGLLFFTAASPLGVELWRTDGTALGTTLTRDIRLGGASSFPGQLTVVGNEIVFTSDDGRGRTLWRSDGTAGGTVPIADTLTGSSSSNPVNLANINGRLMFAASTADSGTELWVSEGTRLSTRLVADISSGAASSNPNHFTWNGDQFVFAATNFTTGNELYVGDASFTEGVLLRDLITGSGSSNPSDFFRIGSQVFFVADSSLFGRELHRTDGTAAGTYVVRNINLGTASALPSHFINYKNILYFQATDGTSGAELWRSDGTTSGTWRVKDIHPGSASSNPSQFAVMDGLLYFNAASAGEGTELWRTDGSDEGTVLVASIMPGLTGSGPSQLTVIGRTLFFTAAGPEGREIWRSDGTAQGTQLVKDIRPGVASCNPSGLTAKAGLLYFSANDGVGGQELWCSDGTADGTVLVADINPGIANSNPTGLVNMGGVLYFAADDGETGIELWQSDGTSSGTVLAADIFAGAIGSSPQSLTAVGSALYFSANAPSIGRELFRVVRSIPQQLIVSHPAGVPLASGSASLAFGRAVLGTTDRRPITLENVGTLPIDLTSVEITGLHAAQFAVQALTQTQLFGNDRSHFDLVFRPTDFGPKSAMLTIRSNDPAQPNFTVSLAGIGGLEPGIQLEDAAGTPIALGGADLQFGNVTLGDAPVVFNVRVSNPVLDSELHVGSLNLSGPQAADFYVDRSSFSSAMLGGTNSVFRVVFRPLGGGPRTAQLTLMSDVPGQSSITITLNGSASPSANVEQLIFEHDSLVSHFAEDGPVILPFASSSGLPVTVEIIGGGGTVEGTTYTPPSTGGSLTFRISQPGGAGYSAAEPIYRSMLFAAGRFASLGKGSSANHCAGIKEDGTLWAWGANDSGQLGLGHTLPMREPTQVGTDNDWAEVVIGKDFTIARKTNGSLWVWGNNQFGQLGIGSFVNQRSPAAIPVGLGWKAIAAGSNHVLAIHADDTLWAWGRNDSLQLGLHSGITTRNTPILISGAALKTIAAGDSHSLGIRNDGSLWGWGNNGQGQLGVATGSGPLPITQIGNDTDWSAIAAGATHTLAIKGVGTLWATGLNEQGQLGLGDTTNRSAFTQVGTGGSWSKMAAGARHSLAMQRNGSLWNWGDNRSGQLASGSTFTFSSPTRVGVDSDWAGVASGANHTLVLKANGTLWVAGVPAEGQMLTPLNHPTRIAAVGIQSASIEDSAAHFIREDGSLWTVGGQSAQHRQPARVGTGEDWTAIASGRHHTLALRGAGSLWSWGRGSNGVLGNESNTDQVDPIQVGVGQDWIQVAAGDFHSAAIKADGTLWTWGANLHGQLGHGNITNRSTPTRVGTDTKWAAVSCGTAVTYAIKTDGTLWAWGNNSNGRLGLGDYTNRALPVRVGSDTDWAAISAGGQHVLALKQDGSLWATGANSRGQLGDGSVAGRISFTLIGIDTDWASIHAGHEHSLAIKSDGTLWAWGLNSSGQYGDASGHPRTTPFQNGNSDSWTFLASGASHAAYSLAGTSEGSLWGFGINAHAQLTDAIPINSELQSVHPVSSQQTLSAAVMSVPSVNTPVLIPASISSGLPIRYSVKGPAAVNPEGTHLTVTGIGTVTLLAWHPGDWPTWRSAPLTQITVLQRPIITTQPLSQTVSHFDSVTFGVEVESGLEVSYQWRHNGQPILGATEASLTIDEAEPADAGSYDVVITNEIGTTTSGAAVLTVVSSTPLIVGVSAPQVLLTGTPLQLAVIAMGKPPLRYQWRKNGRAIAGATAATFSLPDITLSDSCNYSVSVSATRTTTSAAHAVTVVSSLASAVTIDQGRSGILRVTDRGPASSRVWTLNNGPLPASVRFTPSRDGKTLIIKNARTSDAGLYRCIVSRGDEEVVSGATEVIVFNAPPFLTIPQNLPDGIVSGLYHHQITTHPGPTNQPTHYRASGLPPGLRCDPRTGLIQGHPTRSGSFTVNVIASNARGSVSSNEVIEIAPLPSRLAGRYTAVIERQEHLNQLLGGRLDFVVTGKGAYSGSVLLGTQRSAFKGQLNVDPFGLALPMTDISINRKRNSPLRLAFTVQAGSTQTIAGQVAEGDHSSALQGWRQTWDKLLPASAYAGYYTYGLTYDAAHDADTNADRPFGDSFGSISINSSGNFKLSGKMADGIAFSQSNFLGPQGQLGLFATRYDRRKPGSIAGIITVQRGADAESADDNFLSGQPTWSRPNREGTSESLYPSGFDPISLTAHGGRYLPTLLPLIDQSGVFAASLEFADGGLTEATFNPNSVFVFDSKQRARAVSLNPASTTLKVVSRTGLFSGQFILKDPHWKKADPATWNRSIIFQGITTSQSEEGTDALGSGYFLLPQLPKSDPRINPPSVLSGRVWFEAFEE